MFSVIYILWTLQLDAEVKLLHRLFYPFLNVSCRRLSFFSFICCCLFCHRLCFWRAPSLWIHVSQQCQQYSTLFILHFSHWPCINTTHTLIHSHSQTAINTLSFFDAHKLINSDTFCLTHSPPVVSVFGRYTHPSWTPPHGADDRADDESSSMQMETQLPRSICRRFVCVWRVYPAGHWLEGSPVAC